jgi:hypothetical protein
MTASDETDEEEVAQDSSGDDDDSVPNGEEEIDELGRNPTHKRDGRARGAAGGIAAQTRR